MLITFAAVAVRMGGPMTAFFMAVALSPKQNIPL